MLYLQRIANQLRMIHVNVDNVQMEISCDVYHCSFVMTVTVELNLFQM